MSVDAASNSFMLLDAETRRGGRVLMLFDARIYSYLNSFYVDWLDLGVFQVSII